jgi:hypothetical protein
MSSSWDFRYICAILFNNSEVIFCALRHINIGFIFSLFTKKGLFSFYLANRVFFFLGVIYDFRFSYFFWLSPPEIWFGGQFWHQVVPAPSRSQLRDFRFSYVLCQKKKFHHVLIYEIFFQKIKLNINFFYAKN